MEDWYLLFSEEKIVSGIVLVVVVNFTISCRNSSLNGSTVSWVSFGSKLPHVVHHPSPIDLGGQHCLYATDCLVHLTYSVLPTTNLYPPDTIGYLRYISRSLETIEGLYRQNNQYS